MSYLMLDDWLPSMSASYFHHAAVGVGSFVWWWFTYLDES